MRRRTALLLPLAAAVTASGCGNDDRAAANPGPWHGGRIFLATGNTTGVYYQLGGGYADIISRYLPGYEARAEPTGASGENITRLVNGDMEIAFSLADTAADATAGRGPFQGRPQPVRSLARVYSNFTHVIVTTSAKAGIKTMADLKDKRVSTGSPGSGTDALAGRLLTAAGLDPDRGSSGSSSRCRRPPSSCARGRWTRCSSPAGCPPPASRTCSARRRASSRCYPSPT
ncbi:TAXI family TRAP transporter solute-binding subunit [Micromonospora zhanjiangensis]